MVENMSAPGDRTHDGKTYRFVTGEDSKFGSWVGWETGEGKEKIGFHVVFKSLTGHGCGENLALQVAWNHVLTDGEILKKHERYNNPA